MADILTYNGSAVLTGGGQTQEFLNSVGTGTLGVDEGRLQINASVDARGTFNHHEFSSNYFKTLSDGTKFTTTVAADSVTMTSRKDGTDTPVMKLNADGLELGGAPVPTMSFEEARAFLSSLQSADFVPASQTQEYKDALLASVVGGHAIIDMPSVTLPVNADYVTPADMPLIRGMGGIVDLGVGVDGLNKMTLIAAGAFYGGGRYMRVANSDVDYHLVLRSVRNEMFGVINGRTHLARSLRISVVGQTNIAGIGEITHNAAPYPQSDRLPFPIKFFLPAATTMGTATAFRTGYNNGGLQYDAQTTRFDITAAMPRYVSSFSFYKSNFNSPENLVYLMDNLGKPDPGVWPELSFGVDAALVDESGDEVVYLDPKLQAAAQRLIARGWSLAPNPLTD